MDELVQITRAKIICNRIGLDPNEELVAWADKMIVSLDDPPAYLIDISLGELPKEPAHLDIVRCELTDMDCGVVMLEIWSRYENGSIDLEDVGGICYQLGVLAPGKANNRCDAISDEIHIAVESQYPLEKLRLSIESMMKEVMRYAT